MTRQAPRMVLFVLACATALWQAPAGAPIAGGELRGTVRDAATGEPLPGANVLVEGTVIGASCDRRGRFALLGLPPGSYTVTVSLVGYERRRSTVTIGAEAPAELDVPLTLTAVGTEAVIVTGARRRQSSQESPVSVALMDATAIDARNNKTVDEALRLVSGVTITEAQVSVRGSSGYARGVGSRVLLLLDGIPFLTGDTGEINFETVPIGEVDRLEVVKGASSALYGSSALGGVINVITKPAPAEPETRVRLYGGLYGAPSYRQWEWTDDARAQDGQMVSHARRIGDAGLRLYASRMASDGYRQNDARRRYNFFAKGEIPLDPRTDLTLTANLLDQKRDNFLYWRGLDTALVPPAAQFGDRVASTRFNLSGALRHFVSHDLLVTGRAMWFRNRFVSTVGGSDDESVSSVLRGEAQTTWSLHPQHVLVGGADIEMDDVSSDIFSSRTALAVAAYAQDEFRLLDNLTLTFGLRYDLRDLDSLDATGQISPKAGVQWSPVQGTFLRASYGRGFRAPSVAEAFIRTEAGGFPIVPNPALLPERSTSFEIGAAQALGSAALLDVALFRSEFRDLIEAGFTSGTGVGTFDNVTDARVQGVEANLQTAWFDRALTTVLGWTYVDPVDLETGEVLKYRPRHLLQAGVSGRVGPVTAGADYRFISRVERIDDELVTLGIIPDGDARVAVHLLDLRVGVEFGAAALPLRAVLSFSNILQYNFTEIPGNLSPPRYTELLLEAVF